MNKEELDKYLDKEIGSYIEQLNKNPYEKSEFEKKYNRLPLKSELGAFLSKKIFGK